MKYQLDPRTGEPPRCPACGEWLRSDPVYDGGKDWPMCSRKRCIAARVTPTQLTALDYLVEHDGEAYAGHGTFHDATAEAMRKRKLVEVVPGGESVLYRKYRITEQGRAERAKARREKKT